MTIAVGFTALAAQAQAQLTSEWEGNAYVRYTTRYVFRGDKKAGQSMEANVEFTPVATKNGFYVGAWANQPFASERDFEFDLYGGYEYNWLGNVLSAGITGYFFPQSSGLETSYSYEFNVSVSRQIMKNWGVTATLYYDARLQALTPELSTGYRIPYTIGKFPCSLDFSAFVGNSSVSDYYPDAKKQFASLERKGKKWKDGYTYYGATISTTVRVTKNFAGSIGIQYGDTINKALTPVEVGGYGKDTSDNLYGYASISVRW